MLQNVWCKLYLDLQFLLKEIFSSISHFVLIKLCHCHFYQMSLTSWKVFWGKSTCKIMAIQNIVSQGSSVSSTAEVYTVSSLYFSVAILHLFDRSLRHICENLCDGILIIRFICIVDLWNENQSWVELHIIFSENIRPLTFFIIHYCFIFKLAGLSYITNENHYMIIW